MPYQSLQFFGSENLIVFGDEGGSGREGSECGMALYVLGIDEGFSEWVIELVGVPAGCVFPNGNSGVVWLKAHIK
jgi:hypothetical protein